MDWNPNIITSFNEHALAQLEHSVYHQPEKDQLIGLLSQLRDKYAQARKLAGKKALIAFKLKIPKATQGQSIHHHQLGGIPDLFDDINTAAFYAAHNFQEKRAKRIPTLDELVARFWPKSQSTGKPLKFLCSLNVQNWLKLLHHATGVYNGKHEEYTLFSAVGNRNIVQYANTLRVWFDPDFEDTYLSSNAAILLVHEGLFDKPTYSAEEVKAAVIRKQAEAEQVEYAVEYKVPLIPLGVPELAFDLETSPNKEFGTHGLSDEKVDQLREHPLFTYEGAELTLFGQPQSQQTPRRFINTCPHQPHRLTPFLAWSHHQSDITYQLYAATKTFQHDWIEGKIDSSCT